MLDRYHYSYQMSIVNSIRFDSDIMTDYSKLH